MLLALGSAPAAAMSVTPPAIDMAAAGNTKGQIQVVNDGAAPLPVEIVVSRMEMDEAGETSTRPAADDFLVFPPQALIPPGGTQSFRVQWVGDPRMKQSQSYLLSVNQVPVRMPKNRSGVQVVFNFATIVNVDPAGARGTLDLIGTAVGKDGKGRVRPVLTVRNSGDAHAKLTDATIRLSGGSWSRTLPPSELRQIMGMGLVQPGKTRRFQLPLDLPAGVGQVSASLDYKAAK